MSLRSRILASAALLALSVAGHSHAHTSSLGYVPGITVGDVTFWAGSYEHGGTAQLEGAVRLLGLTVTYDQTINFNIGPITTKPTGLIDGTNNFFWAQGGSGYTFPNAVDPIIFGIGISHWQGVTFTGLTAGTYQFGCNGNCGSTQQWNSLTGGTVNLTLAAQDVQGGGPTVDTPEPATMLLLGAGLLGLGVARRKRG